MSQHHLPAVALPERVRRDAMQVACRVVHALDPVPTFPYGGERFLGQLFGLVAIACDETERAEQVVALETVEFLEGERHGQVGVRGS